jgi:hypothetical protein
LPGKTAFCAFWGGRRLAKYRATTSQQEWSERSAAEDEQRHRRSCFRYPLLCLCCSKKHQRQVFLLEPAPLCLLITQTSRYRE